MLELTPEHDAIETDHELITAATDADDPLSEDLAVTLLTDEEAHRIASRRFRREYQTE
jgi:bacterioferritin